MSKSNPSELKLPAPMTSPLSGLKSLNLQVFVMIAAIIVIMLFFTAMTDGAYLSARNVSNLLRQMAITAMLASGMVFVIISGEIDLSVGASLGLLGGICAIMDYTYHLPVPVIIVSVVALGILIGLFNGYWIAYLRVPSFIVSLAGFLAFRGILLGIIEALGAGYIGDLTGGFLGSHYQDIFAFFVLIGVLVFRPSGLIGERVAERA